MNGPKSIEILKNATATTITIICLLTYHCKGKYFYVNVKTLNANNYLNLKILFFTFSSYPIVHYTLQNIAMTSVKHFGRCG